MRRARRRPTARSRRWRPRRRTGSRWSAAALAAGHTVEEVAEGSSDRPVVRRPDRAGGRGARPRSAAERCRRRARTSCGAAKRLGLSDPRLARLTGSTDAAVRRHREALGVAPVFKTVDTCAGEFAARTPYHYSTYEDETEVRPATRPRVRDPGRRAEPDRAGDRVRLRVRARGVRPGGGRVRVGDGQLEPRDRLDRLRHVEPAVLRAADGRGRPGGMPRGTAGRA